LSGRIENPDTAADLITYNQSVSVLGIFGHPPGGLMSAAMVGSTASQSFSERRIPI
jgi:hypothetical protein